MKHTTVEIADLSRSVIAVPPLALNEDLLADRTANARIIDHMAQDGVTTLMYGGNANFYDLPIGRYAETLNMLIDLSPPDTWIIPAVGPDFGRMRDQVPVLKDLGFPTAMALPQPVPGSTNQGFLTGMRRLHDLLGAPLVMYVKHDHGPEPAEVARLVDDGVVGSIKYAAVRPDPAEDPLLAQLVSLIEPSRIISGIGERPVIDHFRHFGLTSFTSGSAAVAPALSTAILRALKAGDLAAAGALRELFLPLEDCRDAFGPARVLHDAVTLSGIADMGPMSPMQSNLTEAERTLVERAASELVRQQQARPAEETGAPGVMA